MLQGLSPQARDAILLRLVAGLSNAEVGAILGKNPAAVKMLVHRTLSRLRRSWQEEAAE